jgi:hypothetical protein
VAPEHLERALRAHAVDAGVAVELLGRHAERGVVHAERIENRFAQQRVEGCAARLLRHGGERLVGRPVGEVGPGMEGQGNGRQAARELADRLGFLPQALDGLASLDVLGLQARLVGQQVMNGDRPGRRHEPLGAVRVRLLHPHPAVLRQEPLHRIS